LNNFTDEELKRLELAGETNKVSYVVFAKEIGENGTPHLQGYVELHQRKTLNGLKLLLDLERLHVEVAKGNWKQNLEYCSKQNPPKIFGEPMQQGKRSDLEEMKQAIQTGLSLKDISNEYFGNYIRYHRGLTQYYILNTDNQEYAPPQVKVYWGKPGTGKSKKAHEEEDIWTWPGKEWFDGYYGQKTALFDDFDGTDFSYRLLLRILDRYPINVPTKGSFVAWRPTLIILTSNIHPKSWYNLADDTALLRRIHEINEFN